MIANKDIVENNMNENPEMIHFKDKPDLIVKMKNDSQLSSNLNELAQNIGYNNSKEMLNNTFPYFLKMDHSHLSEKTVYDAFTIKDNNVVVWRCDSADKIATIDNKSSNYIKELIKDFDSKDIIPPDTVSNFFKSMDHQNVFSQTINKARMSGPSM